MAFTTPRTWVYGETVTEAQFNEQLRDNFNAVWVGTTAGDIDFYTSSTSKTRLAGGTANANKVLTMGTAGTAPAWNTINIVQNRQGGGTVDWNTVGTTNYSVANSLVQCGMIEVSLSVTHYGYTTITFPVAYSAKPLVLVSASQNTIYPFVSDITSTGCKVSIGWYDGTSPDAQPITWLAIGPSA